MAEFINKKCWLGIVIQKAKTQEVFEVYILNIIFKINNMNKETNIIFMKLN